MNVLKVLASAGVEPEILMKLYTCYIRSLIEYGSISFLSAPKGQLSRLQKIQNDAIRTCLRLPRYLRTSLIHEYAGIEPVNDRLQKVCTKLLSKIITRNEDVQGLVENRTPATGNCHLSPLDVLIEA